MENTHAKNRFLRRIENRNGGKNKGKSIEGELTPTEIAKKVRRKARRIPNLQKAVTMLEAKKEASKQEILLIEKELKNKDIKAAYAAKLKLKKDAAEAVISGLDKYISKKKNSIDVIMANEVSLSNPV